MPATSLWSLLGRLDAWLDHGEAFLDQDPLADIRELRSDLAAASTQPPSPGFTCDDAHRLGAIADELEHLPAEIRRHLDQDGRDARFLRLKQKQILDALSQPPSPQAEVQDCSCPHAGTGLGLLRTGTDSQCPIHGTGKQSPAEPQGEGVEKLAKKFWQLRTLADNLPSWEELSDEDRAGKLANARGFLAAITPLLPGPSYARERIQPALDTARGLAERINQELNDYPAYSSAEDAIQEAEAALDKEDSE
jgi:hypothetical protein